MWNPFGKHPAEVLSRNLNRLLTDRGVVEPLLSRVRVAHHTGLYDNRKVIFFRVYDPDTTPMGHAGNAPHYEELAKGNVLQAGWVEGDGHTVFYSGESMGYTGRETAHA